MASALPHDTRLACANAAYDLRDLLKQWQGVSHEVRIAIIKDAIEALELVPPPDEPEYGN